MDTLPEAGKISGKIIRNTVFNSASRIWDILIGIVLTPFIIHHLGLERYGLWIMIGAVTGYFGLFDFGVGGSSVKYIAEFHSEGRLDRINNLLNTGLLFHSSLAACVIILAIALAKPFLVIFKIPPYFAKEAVTVLITASVGFGLNSVFGNFAAVQGGLQRMDISGILAICASIVGAVTTVTVLLLGYGLAGLVCVQVLIFSLFGIINTIVAFRLLPGLRVHWSLANLPMFRKMFGFGAKVQVSALATLFHFQLDKFLLASFLNLAYVSFYSIASNLVAKTRLLPLMVVSALFPVASELHAKDDRKGLRELYTRAFKYTILIALPTSLLLMLMARPFIALWIGPGYELSGTTLQLLVVAYCANTLTAPGFLILNGMGRTDVGMKSSILAAALNLVLSVTFVIKFGYFGLVMGTVISMTTAAVYFLYLAQGVLGIELKALFIRPFIAASVPFVALLLVKSSLHVCWRDVFFIGALYTILYLVLVLALGCLDSFDYALHRKLFYPVGLLLRLKRP
jgi:O-antigen/teichoic acid export membrane protein